MKNCILKGLCVIFIFSSLVMMMIPATVNAQSGQGGTTEVIAQIKAPTEPPTEGPTEPDSDAGKLRITASRPESADLKEQSFVYLVSGYDGLTLAVTVVLTAGETSGSVTIAQLAAGDYTVTEVRDWSWRYSDGASRTVTVGTDLAEAVFDHTMIRFEWLDGYSHRCD